MNLNYLPVKDGVVKEAAFKELYISFYPRIYAAAFSLLRHHQAAEDVTQQVFLRLWEGWSTIEAANLEGYLITMAKNTILNQFRSNTVQSKYRRYLKEQLELPAGNVEDLLIERQQLSLLQDTVRHLPPRQQQAWRLAREQGLTYREIARQMGISKDSVKELMQKASAAIKALLGSITLWITIIIFLLGPPPQRHQLRVNNQEAVARSYD
ncbi:hypothetical protein DCC81_03510 [Chitinophaga parva]|uniref:RNA polymerase sigma-70 factor n=1 Tax=Chitinophaga parva TaxID=2169414 RepID=A0A2T7BLR0_9BACT|nr:hypothetical protein DCC81_03510 [Chitinophaga parva]